MRLNSKIGQIAKLELDSNETKCLKKARWIMDQISRHDYSGLKDRAEAAVQAIEESIEAFGSVSQKGAAANGA